MVYSWVFYSFVYLFHEVIVNQSCICDFSLNNLLLVYRKAKDFCMLGFDLVNLQNLFIRSKSFVVGFFRIFYRITSSSNRDILGSSVFIGTLLLCR